MTPLTRLFLLPFLTVSILLAPVASPIAEARHGARAYRPAGHGGPGMRGAGPRGAGPRGQAPRGYAPRGHAPRGQAVRGHAPRGHAPRGYAPRGYAPRGPSPRAYVPRGPAPRGYVGGYYRGYARGHVPQGYYRRSFGPRVYVAPPPLFVPAPFYVAPPVVVVPAPQPRMYYAPEAPAVERHDHYYLEDGEEALPTDQSVEEWDEESEAPYDDAPFEAPAPVAPLPSFPTPQGPSAPDEAPAGESGVLSDDELGAIESEIVRLVNAERAEAGLPALSPDPIMASAALQHSSEMFSLDYFSHESPVDGNKEFTDRLRNAGLAGWGAAGENIVMAGYEQGIAARFVQLWMDSPGHRENIMRPEFRFTGVGVFGDGTKVYATQLFASEAKAADGGSAGG